jgi:hypothetical protein
MGLMWLLLEASTFHEQIHPALAACSRQRSFLPCQELSRSLAPAVRAYAERFFTSAEESLLSQISGGLPFNRSLWRLLVGEILLYSAAEIPEIQAAPELFCSVLAPDHYRHGPAPRERFTPIEQAHYGSRDLTFGGGYYRPEKAGWNDQDDVSRLADYLGTIDPSAWTTANPVALPEVADEEERAEELEDARAWFPALRGLYEQARDRRQVVVCEIM